VTRRPPRRTRGRLAECRDCADVIVWVRLTTGSAIAVQPVPNPRGNVATRAAGGELYGYVVSATKPATPEHVLMMPHAAVCKSRPPRTPADLPKPEPDPPAPDLPLF